MIKVGIICPAEVALNRFIPALLKCSHFKYVGVAVANREEYEGVTDTLLKQEYNKAKLFVESVGGKLFNSYSELINSREVDSVYLPLPPGLHYKWVKYALLAGKHVLVEKPCAETLEQTEELIQIAKNNSLVLYENYAFIYHKQIYAIQQMIDQRIFGDIRLYRINFGFPLRSSNDFRYNKLLGGGALLDCAGQVLRYASMLLGDTAKIMYAHKNFINEYEVDMYGSATMINSDGLVAQLSWGMDNCYRCELDVWGNKGCLKTSRILTAPVGFKPTAIVKIGNESEQIITLPEDDVFYNSINNFYRCIIDSEVREETYKYIKRQSELISSCYK